MSETGLDNQNDKKNSFVTWLMEDDSPDIGIASKEPLNDYLKGIIDEFKKITWPTTEAVKAEFVAVIVIVSLISIGIYSFDLFFDKIFGIFK